MLGRAVLRSRVSPLFAPLHRSPPQFAKRSEAGHQGVVAKALREGQSAVVAYALEGSLNTVLQIIGRPLGPAVEEDVELYLELSNIVLKPRQLLVNSRLIIQYEAVLGSLLSLLFGACPPVFTNWQCGWSP